MISYSCSGNQKSSKNENTTSEDKKIKSDSLKSDYLNLGFELIGNENFSKLRLGLNPDSIIILLGYPDEKTTPKEWAATGSAYQSYIYNSLGLRLDLVLSPDSSFNVKMITIKSPCDYKSSRGIGINSSYDDVKKYYHKYIDYNSSDSNNIVAGSVYGGILFKFENNKVKSIFIGAAAD